MKTCGHVLYCSDDAGFSQLRVALHSLLKSADADRPLRVHVFTADSPLSPAHTDELLALTARHPNASLAVENLTEAFAPYRPTFVNPAAAWSVTTWLRAFAGRLADETDRVVYMDIDTLVCRDLGELFDRPLATNVLAGVFEDARGDGRAAYFWDRLADPDMTRYVNAGVLVLNAKAFRDENLLDVVASWYAAHRDEAIRLDQDAFNALFWKRTARLHPKYNYSDGWCERHVKCSRRAEHWRGSPPREILEAVVDPAIIHFWGPRKPWRWNHRPEGCRYAAALRELGLLTGALPGTTPFRRIQSLFYSALHAALRRLARARM